MQITLSKILGLIVALGYLVFAGTQGGVAALKPCAGLVIPLAFIWFPEEIGNLTGYFDSGYVNVKTPGVIVSLLGWFLLVGVPVLLFLLTRATR